MAKKKNKNNSSSLQSKLNPDAKIDSAAAKRFGLRAFAICVIIAFILFAAVGFSFDIMVAVGEPRNTVRDLCYFGLFVMLCCILTMVFMQLFWLYRRAKRRRQLMKPLEQSDEGKNE